MRLLEKDVVEQRGCKYCADSKRIKVIKAYKRVKKPVYVFQCSYEVCPYTELDSYKSYEDFLKK